MALDDELFRALAVLRAAPAPLSAAHDAQWRVVDRALAEWTRGPRAAEALALRQATLLRVSGAVHAMRAETPSAAIAWLRQRLRSCRATEARRLSKEGARAARRPTTRDRHEPDLLDTLAAPAASRGATLASDEALALLAEHRERLEDAVDAFLARRVAGALARAAARKKAELALAAHLDGLTTDELFERVRRPDGPSRTTLYKWVERGRERVVIPALEAWVRQLEDDEPVRTYATEVLELFRGTRRADAGKPRGKKSAADPAEKSGSGGF